MCRCTHILPNDSVVYGRFNVLTDFDENQLTKAETGWAGDKTLKGLAQTKIIKKSLILFWLLNMTI